MDSLTLLAIAGVAYLLPVLVASSRGKANTLAIGVLNVLLGWTLIGWVVAMVWACTAEAPRRAGETAPAGGPSPAISGEDSAEARMRKARVWIAIVACLAALFILPYVLAL